MADLRIQYDEEMVGAGHPTKEDTINRLALVEHDEDGTHNQATLNQLDQDPETGAEQMALYVKEISGAPELCVRGESDGDVIQLTSGGALSAGMPGFIQGLVPGWASGTALSFVGGSLDIEGVRYTLSSAFTNLACSGLSAGTWYYVYVEAPSSGFALSVSQFSVSASAPSWSDSLGYWASTGKRCVFAFKTDGSGYVLPFACDGRACWFAAGAEQILSTSSPATSATTLAVGLPALGVLAWWGTAWVYQNNAASYYVFMAPGNVSGDGSVCIAKANAPGEYIHPFVMMSGPTGNVGCQTTWGGAGTLKLYLRGYQLPAGMAR